MPSQFELFCSSEWECGRSWQATAHVATTKKAWVDDQKVMLLVIRRAVEATRTNEIPGRWCFFSKDMYRSWTRRETSRALSQAFAQLIFLHMTFIEFYGGKIGGWEPGWRSRVESLWSCGSPSGRRNLASNLRQVFLIRHLPDFEAVQNKRLKSSSQTSEQRNQISLGVSGLSWQKTAFPNQKPKRVMTKEQR